MKVVAVLLLAVVAVAFANEFALNDDIIDEVNRSDAPWIAGRNDRFENVTLGEARRMLGLPPRPFSRLLKHKVHYSADPIPTSFDARKQWPSCIHAIMDQAQCGSCWAFGAIESLSDRICIGTSGKTNVILSPQWLVSCDTDNFGCQGGYLDKAWDYMVSHGLPSEQCVPYTSGGGDTGKCPTKCKDGSAPTFYKAKNEYAVTGVENIQREIMTNGPVEVAFSVYQDFFSYKSGVYVHKSGGLAGGHAVKAVGWGTLNNVDYWLIANSWGTSWGENGFFMIKRGVDECGIEDNVVAGMPAV